MRQEDSVEIARLRGLLGRYANHVYREEGVDFLESVHPLHITQEEADEIQTYAKQQEGVVNVIE